MKICRKSMQTAYTEAGEGKETAGAETRLLRRMQCCQVETGRTQMHIIRRFPACVPYHVPRCV